MPVNQPLHHAAGFLRDFNADAVAGDDEQGLRHVDASRQQSG